MQMLQTVPCTKQSKPVRHIGSDLERDEGQVSRMDRKEAIEYAKFRLECHTKGDGEYTDYGEFLVVAIAALQEPERIIKQLEELRDEPLMYCSEDYWEGHYIAAKEAIAIVRGEEE